MKIAKCQNCGNSENFQIRVSSMNVAISCTVCYDYYIFIAGAAPAIEHCIADYQIAQVS